MIEIKANKKTGTVDIEARGSLSELMVEFSLITASLTHNLLRSCNTEYEYERMSAMISGACAAGIKHGVDRRRKEVQHG